MQLSINTNFVRDNGNPEPHLRQIAEAGFTHVLWAHHFKTDFLYSQSEIGQIRAWLQQYGLQLLDLHGSMGVEKNWVSRLEYERLAGVELVKNRVNMAAELRGKVVIMHTGLPPAGQEQTYCQQLRRSLDELEPHARERGVCIALENWDNWSTIGMILADYSPDFIGVCYDSGHGNLFPGSVDELATVKDRLISVHLHDNNGSDGQHDLIDDLIACDQHKLPFSGTVPWARLVGIIALSSYTKCVSMEVGIVISGIQDGEIFLEQAFETGTRLSRMLTQQRELLHRPAIETRNGVPCCSTPQGG